MNMPVVSFYSYKGGAGRTVCLANTIGFISEILNATNEKPILLIDMDLDSAGLTILFEMQRNVQSGDFWTSYEIVQNEVRFAQINVRNQLIEKTIDISNLVGAPNGTVRFIGGSQVGAEGDDERVSMAEENLKHLIRFCRHNERLSAIIIDSSSGRQMGARLVHNISDIIVYCSRLSYQFAYGTEKQIKYFIKSRIKIAKNLPKFMLLPIAIPRDCGDRWANLKEARRQSYINLALDISQNTQCIFWDEGIPEIERFKWKEDILKNIEIDDLNEEEESALSKYFIVSKILCLMRQHDNERIREIMNL